MLDAGLEHGKMTNHLEISRKKNRKTNAISVVKMTSEQQKTNNLSVLQRAVRASGFGFELRIWASGFGLRDSGFGIRDSGFGIFKHFKTLKKDSGFEFGIRDSGFGLLKKFEKGIRDSGFGLL